MIEIVFGNIGAGKTTYGARMVYKNNQKKKWVKRFPFLKRILKPYDRIFCNESTMKDTIFFHASDIGKYRIPCNSLFIIDEAGIELSNRNWKKLEWYIKNEAALCRHRGHDYLLLSQTVDIDIVFRQRSQKLSILYKRGNRTLVEQIPYKIDVDNEKHELVESYTKYDGFLVRLVARLLGRIYSFNRRKYYKMFDSFIDNYPYPEDKTPANYL